jgi:outer membrane lipopolysaccharide assembly protein LptE/RlpB
MGSRLQPVQSGAWRLSLLVAVFLSTGCGFHLRTFDLNTAVSSVHVSSNGRNFVEQPLRAGLQQAGVELMPVRDEAQIAVALLNLIEPRWAETSRIYRVDRVNLVGTSEEQALLEREMINDLVQQIVRALDAATQELAVAG